LPDAVAFCPAGISSLFEVCRSDNAGNALTDPIRVGARGGGFVISRGITSRVSVRKRRRTRVEIRINSVPAPNARTTRYAIEHLVSAAGRSLGVLVEVRVEVPIAAGFGTSAAGTLASCLALTEAGDLHVTLNQLGTAAHVAEVLNGTGLGTVPALLCGGFVLVREPGAPGIGLIDRLRFPPNHSLVCAYLGPIQTKDALHEETQELNRNVAAHVALEKIRENPTLPVFLTESRKFGRLAGFETRRISRLISTMTSAGAIGAAQNMIGEAVHAVVEDSKTRKVFNAVRKSFPDANVFTTHIESQGVRSLT